MSMLSVVLGLAVVLPPSPRPAPAVAPATVADDAAIEVVVETERRPDWLFPGLDHPRVQAFFRSGSTVGRSLLDPEPVAMRRPLVRAGAIKVDAASTAAERRAARRYARAWVASVRPALEACYADTLARSPSDAARLTIRVELRGRGRGAVSLADGTLGDLYGNACVHGVLEFADAELPGVSAALEIPVWFWLQTV